MLHQIVENIGSSTFLYGAFALLIVLWLSKYIRDEIKIRHRGGHAKRLQSWLPLGKANIILSLWTS